ncbi:hypothetical protein D9757_011970 [Collybiopsis confluens]|uniref:Uncharacterized protein n=1 Tax=Collybiopsis confluens TaxID=2823264 RepID=A0A8H5LPB3_9AGAR|nr:hypothetical protein D9757_011970 [Collybiopsis confluens]
MLPQPVIRLGRRRAVGSLRKFRPSEGTEPSSIQPPSAELIAQFVAKHDAQESSPLFHHVLPEIRNTIFLYALLSYEDQSIAYPNDAHYSRPEYRFSIRIDTRLLQTCRLVYLETRFLPVITYEHTFWGHRAPPGITHASNPRAYFERFTEAQRDHVDRVHFFTQQFYLERNFPNVCLVPAMRPRSLKITLRHGDWWNWETNNPLKLRNGWADKLESIARLEEVILELETMERDKAQINAIAERVRKETYPASNGRIFTARGNPLVRSEWMGPNRLSNLFFDSSQNKWVARNLKAEENVPDPGLKYCIVCIKWTARTKDEELNWY